MHLNFIALTIPLACLLGTAFATPSALQVLTHGKDCDSTNSCPGGCCPVEGWFCCEDGHYCALGSSDCPGTTNKISVMHLAPFSKAQGPECPDGQFGCDNGCCPNMGWYCCEDGKNCASSAEKCPPAAKKAPKVSLLSKTKDCDSTNSCPGGCCPVEGWYCCEDGHYCALGSSDCPGTTNKISVMHLAPFSKAQGPECPDGQFGCDNGCCPNMGWYCCEDGKNCASSAEKCPPAAKKAPKVNHIAKVKNTPKIRNYTALTKTAQCDGVLCPTGCCAHAGWVCCENPSFCADIPEDCP